MFETTRAEVQEPEGVMLLTNLSRDTILSPPPLGYKVRQIYSILNENFHLIHPLLTETSNEGNISNEMNSC